MSCALILSFCLEHDVEWWADFDLVVGINLVNGVF